MENISELKQHLHAVEQTRQISNAMYLLATSRMKKSMQNIEYNLTYMRRLRATIKDIVSKTKHNMLSDPFIELTEGGKALFFVITSDKGLCGGYNSAVFNLAMEKMREYSSPVVYSLGLKGTEMFVSHGITPDDNWYGASQKPSLTSFVSLTKYCSKTWETMSAAPAAVCQAGTVVLTDGSQKEATGKRFGAPR